MVNVKELIDCRNSEAYFWRGMAKKGVQGFSGAIADITRVLTMDNCHIKAYLERGILKIEIIWALSGTSIKFLNWILKTERLELIGWQSMKFFSRRIPPLCHFLTNLLLLKIHWVREIRLKRTELRDSVLFLKSTLLSYSLTGEIYL